MGQESTEFFVKERDVTDHWQRREKLAFFVNGVVFLLFIGLLITFLVAFPEFFDGGWQNLAVGGVLCVAIITPTFIMNRILLSNAPIIRRVLFANDEIIVTETAERNGKIVLKNKSRIDKLMQVHRVADEDIILIKDKKNKRAILLREKDFVDQEVRDSFIELAKSVGATDDEKQFKRGYKL